MTDNTLRISPAYRVAHSMFVALGGDPMTEFSSVEEIYDAIDVLFGKGNNRITVEAIAMEIVENGDYNFDDEDVTGYKPVNIKVDVPQKYTDEQVENIRVEAENTGYNNGYGVGMNDGYNNGYGVGYAEGDAAGQQTGYNTGYGEGFTVGETEGYNDGYAEGLDDGAEDQKALLEDITITTNGVYEKEDGYKKVTVEMAAVPSGDGFDFSELGYSESFSNDLNTYLSEYISNGKNYKDNFKTGTSFTETTIIKTPFFPLIDLSQSATVYFPDSLIALPDATITMSNVSSSYSGMFYESYSLIKVGKINYPNAAATNRLFQSCYLLKSVDGIIAPLSKNTEYMFQSCYNLMSIKELQFGDVTTGRYMFQNCNNLENIPQFNTKFITDGTYMFSNCYKLKSLFDFDATSLTNGYYMFQHCDNLESVKILNSTKLDNASYMFVYCGALKNVEIDTSNVTNASNMFSDTAVEILNLDLRNATSISSLCSYNANLKEANILTSSKLTKLDYAFQRTYGLEKLSAIDCTNLNSNLNWFGNFGGQTYALRDFGGLINYGGNGYIPPVSYGANFEYCPNLTHDSLMNIINNLADITLINKSGNIKFSSSSLAILSDEEKAIATNKGWTLA